MHALRYNLHYLGFGFSAFSFFNKFIAKSVKKNIKKRFVFSTNLINPFFCTRASLKNYFIVENDLNYFFDNGIFFHNALEPFEDLTFSFYSNISVFKCNFFFDNSLYGLQQLKFYTRALKKYTLFFSIRNNFFFLKNFKKLLVMLAFVTQR